MSLYTWLAGGERHPHFNTERDLSNPRPVEWGIYPPTFITYKVNITESDIKQYILELLDSNQTEYLEIIYQRVLNEVNNNLQLVTREIIEDNFRAITEQEIDSLF